MNSFYSILHVPIRPAGQEYLNIGLLFIGERESYFRFSNRKLELVKKLIPENSHSLLRSYLIGLAENIKTGEEASRKFRESDFVNYLSNYNNNLITFSKPTPIDLEVNEKTFQLLFEKFIFSFEERNEDVVEPKSPSIQKILKSNLYPRIKQRVNVDPVLTSKEVPTLLVPSVKVNFIGQNGSPVAGQGVDFEKSSEQITDSISRFISLIKAFEQDNKHGHYYIVGKEPDKTFKEQHDNWLHIKQSGLIEFVDINETEKISDYIEQHNVRPFIPINS